MSDSPTITLRLLQALHDGDEHALDKLIEHTHARLTRLARMMYADFSSVHHREEMEDILQNALLRLMNALKELSPAASKDFYRLAAIQIRRELLDVARKVSRTPCQGFQIVDSQETGSDLAAQVSNSTYNPAKVAIWSEFHEQVEKLPDDERVVFDLVWYHGLQQVEAAEALGVDPKTIQRRWRRAVDKLLHAVPGLQEELRSAAG